MFLLGVFVGVGGVALISWLYAKKQEKQTAKQLQEVAQSLKDETAVNEEKGVENNG